MAQRFGGKYSPGSPASPPGQSPATPTTTPQNAFDGKRPARMGARSNFLFVAVLAFLIPGFTGGGAALVQALRMRIAEARSQDESATTQELAA